MSSAVRETGVRVRAGQGSGVAVASHGRRRGWDFVWLATLGVANCLGASEADIKARFAMYVDAANSCTTAGECALASADCPLGCYVPVRADRKADVEAKARELVSEYERGGRKCAYECVAPGQLACVQRRCALVEPQPPDAGVPEAGMAPPSGGSIGPQPSVPINFSLFDGETNVGARPLAVTVYDRDALVDDARLSDLANRVVLKTWPEKGAVGATTQTGGPGVPSGQKGITLRPDMPLEDRWYLLEVVSLPGLFTYWPLLDGGLVGVRFRPGSAPRISRIQVCEKAAPGAKVVVHVSEPVTAQRPPADVITVQQGGKPLACELYQTVEAGFYFACTELTRNTVEVSVGAGLNAPSGNAVPPGSWTFDPGQLPEASGCRDFRPPLD